MENSAPWFKRSLLACLFSLPLFALSYCLLQPGVWLLAQLGDARGAEMLQGVAWLMGACLWFAAMALLFGLAWERLCTPAEPLEE